MQNLMRIARALSKRRKDSIAIEVDDLAEACWYVDFVNRDSLNGICSWLGLNPVRYDLVRSGGRQLVAEAADIIQPLSLALNKKMAALPFSLENIIGEPSTGYLDETTSLRWQLAQELQGQMVARPSVSTIAPQPTPVRETLIPTLSNKQLKAQLSQVLLGQADVIDEVLDALTDRGRDRCGLPLVFFAVGPAGSGKSMLAQQLGKLLPGYSLRKFEMSTYSSRNDFGLTGLRYGYADAHPGELTSYVRKNPKSIIVFENIERAHPAVQHALVPAISEGVLHDQYWAALAEHGAFRDKGSERPAFNFSQQQDLAEPLDPAVSFADCILIFTSTEGAAAHDLHFYNDRSKMSIHERAEMLLGALRGEGEKAESPFAPGLLNALTESTVLPFCRLDFSALLQLAQTRLREAAERWGKAKGVAVRIKEFRQMAELFLLTLGHRATARNLTLKHAEAFLFSGLTTGSLEGRPKRIILALAPDDQAELLRLRERLGPDPVLTSFRKHQTVACSRRVISSEDGVSLVLGGFRVEAGKSAFDMAVSGGIQVELPDIQFGDIVGHEKAKQRLRQVAKLLSCRDELERLKVDCPRGMLLFGPAGTGKTMLAKAFAREADLPFIAVTGTELLDTEVVRKLFARLRRYAPAVLFIDEVDAIGQRGRNTWADAVINQLLAEIDGFNSALSEPLFVIAATNYPEKLDDALLRSGRIDLQVEVPRLGKEERREFLVRYRMIPGLESFDEEQVLNVTSNLSGADLEKGRREIILEMARQGRANADVDMLFAKLAEIKHGEMRDVTCADEELEHAAFHEAGHAVIAQVLLPEQRIEHVSIEVRGRNVGAVSFVVEKGRIENLDGAQVRKQLCMLLAGRMAEMKRFGESGCNAGAASDLRQATELASRAVMCWGLDQTVGMLAFGSPDGGVPELSEAPAWVIERIQVWLDQARHDVQPLLEQHWPWIESVAAKLVQCRSVGAAQLVQLRQNQGSYDFRLLQKVNHPGQFSVRSNTTF